MTAKLDNIGGHIRKLRKLQHKTLQEIADICGYTKSLLSKIESGKVVPPVATLVKIASALNTNVSALVEEGNSIDCVFIPAEKDGARSVPTSSGYSILPLAVELKQKKMQPFLFTATPENLNDKLHSHIGEEFVYVLEGTLDFQVGLVKYSLQPGDSIFFNSVVDHKIMNVVSDHAKLLVIFN